MFNAMDNARHKFTKSPNEIAQREFRYLHLIFKEGTVLLSSKEVNADPGEDGKLDMGLFMCKSSIRKGSRNELTIPKFYCQWTVADLKVEAEKRGRVQHGTTRQSAASAWLDGMGDEGM